MKIHGRIVNGDLFGTQPKIHIIKGKALSFICCLIPK